MDLQTLGSLPPTACHFLVKSCSDSVLSESELEESELSEEELCGSPGSFYPWHNPFSWVLGCVLILSGRDEGRPSGSSSGRPPWPGEAQKACPASKSQATLFACCDGLARACDVALRPLWLASQLNTVQIGRASCRERV